MNEYQIALKVVQLGVKLYPELKTLAKYMHKRWKK